MKNRIECQALHQAFAENMEANGADLQAAMDPPQVEGPEPTIHDPVVIEDLESGEVTTHDQAPSVESMPKDYIQAVMDSSKTNKSKGVKRVMGLHFAIQAKSRGENGSPLQGLSSSAEAKLNARVQKAIDMAQEVKPRLLRAW